MQSIEDTRGSTSLAEHRYPRVEPVPAPPGGRSLLDVLGDTIERHGDRIAIDAADAVLTYAQLSDAADRLADRQRFAPLPSLGWERAYRSGDLVRETAHGLDFVGRRDQQVKLAGRRLELGEVEAQLRAARGVRAAAVVVQSTAAANKILVGYVVGDVNPEHVRAQA
jgi:non-ribosomal peptide synthetase component F